MACALLALKLQQLHLPAPVSLRQGSLAPTSQCTCDCCPHCTAGLYFGVGVGVGSLVGGAVYQRFGAQAVYVAACAVLAAGWLLCSAAQLAVARLELPILPLLPLVLEGEELEGLTATGVGKRVVLNTAVPSVELVDCSGGGGRDVDWRAAAERQEHYRCSSSE